MTKKFPLPLSSVVEKKPAERTDGTRFSEKVATRQTAVQNAARDTQQSHSKNQEASPTSRKPLPPAQAPVASSDQLVSARVRRAMVERLERQGVRDSLVLAAMEAVPRHLFVDSGLASQAYTDASLPIGHQQTISRPYIVARMIEIMRNATDDQPMGRVLEIGTGCGYQAAVLSQVAREVYSIERIKALHELAKTRLRPLRIPNLRLHHGDGMLGLSQAAPFDGIILAAAGLEVPNELLMQLAPGGRLIAPVGNVQQSLQLTERVNKLEWKTTILENCHFVPLCPGTV